MHHVPRVHLHDDLGPRVAEEEVPRQFPAFQWPKLLGVVVIADMHPQRLRPLGGPVEEMRRLQPRFFGADPLARQAGHDQIRVPQDFVKGGRPLQLVAQNRFQGGMCPAAS